MQGRGPTTISDLSAELPSDHPLLRLGWAGSAVMVPIQTSGGSLGFVAIANAGPGRRFSDSGVAALDHFARQAALAVHYGQVRNELQRLAVLEDRARIARELHDGVIQSLFGAGILLEATVEIEELPVSASAGLARVAEMIDRTMLDLRSYIFDLEPSALVGRSLRNALQRVAREFQESSAIECRVAIDADAVKVLEDKALQIIQIVREALSNVVRHALASICQIELRQDAGGVLLQVSDNGRGFVPSAVTWGNGLENISRRALGIGAQVDFMSEPGVGSMVRIMFPVNATG
jgi:signal transduction histidine kinase